MAISSLGGISIVVQVLIESNHGQIPVMTALRKQFFDSGIFRSRRHQILIQIQRYSLNKFEFDLGVNCALNDIIQRLPTFVEPHDSFGRRLYHFQIVLQKHFAEIRGFTFSSENSHLHKSSRVLGPLNIRSLYWQMLQKLYSSISSSSMHSSHTLFTIHRLGTCRKEPQDALWQFLQTVTFFEMYPCWHGFVWQSNLLQFPHTICCWGW